MSAAEQQEHNPVRLRVVHAISRTVVDSQLTHAGPDGLHIAWIAHGESVGPCGVRARAFESLRFVSHASNVAERWISYTEELYPIGYSCKLWYTAHHRRMAVIRNPALEPGRLPLLSVV